MEQIGRLEIKGKATLEQAAALRDELHPLLRTKARIVIDCSAATEFDLSALQLFCAAHRAAATLGKNLCIEGGGELLRQAKLEAGFRSHSVCRSAGMTQRCLWQD